MTLMRLNALSNPGCNPRFGFGKADSANAEQAKSELTGLPLLPKQVKKQYGMPLSGYTVGNTDTNASFKPLGDPKHPNGYSYSSSQQSEFFTYA